MRDRSSYIRSFVMFWCFALSASARAEVFDVDSVKLPPKSSLQAKKKPLLNDKSRRDRLRVEGASPYFSDAVTIDNYDQTALLGKGFDILTGAVKAFDACVTSNLNSRQTGDDWLSNDTFTSLRSFTNSSKSGVSFGFTYKILDLSFDSSDSVESQTNTVDAFGRFYRRIWTQIDWFDSPQWTTSAKALLNKPTLADFVDECGTHYIRAIHWGHSVDQALRFTLLKTARTSSSSNDLSVGVKNLISLGSNDATTQKTVSDSSTFTHTGHDHGHIAAPQLTNNVNSIPALYQFVVYDYAQQVAALPKREAYPNRKGDVLALEIVPYRESIRSPLTQRIPRWPEEIFTYLERIQGLVTDFESNLLAMRYAKSFESTEYDKLFAAPAYLDLQAKIDAADVVKANLKAAVDVCEELMRSAMAPDSAARDTCIDRLAKAITPQNVSDLKMTRK